MKLFTASAILGLVLVGCKGESAEAEATVKKAEAACKAGKPDDALNLMGKVAETNETFGDAFRLVTEGHGDRAHLNPCGPVLKAVKAQLNLE